MAKEEEALIVFMLMLSPFIILGIISLFAPYYTLCRKCGMVTSARDDPDGRLPSHLTNGVSIPRQRVKCWWCKETYHQEYPYEGGVF